MEFMLIQHEDEEIPVYCQRNRTLDHRASSLSMHGNTTYGCIPEILISLRRSLDLRRHIQCRLPEKRPTILKCCNLGVEHRRIQFSNLDILHQTSSGPVTVRIFSYIGSDGRARFFSSESGKSIPSILNEDASITSVNSQIGTSVSGTDASVSDLNFIKGGKNNILSTGNNYYDGDLVKGCPHGFGRFTFGHVGLVYEGEWQHGLEHGMGELRLLNGHNSMQEGRFSRNFQCAAGEVQFRKDDTRLVYRGEFKYGKFNGFGLYLFRNGDYYEGNWVNGIREGRGVYFETLERKIGSTSSFSCCKYDGEWENDERHGYGEQIFSYSHSQQCLKAQRMKHGHIRGYGYFGQWDHNKRQGWGMLILPPISSILPIIYEGHFENNDVHGRGTCGYSDGSKYEGVWKHGVRDGRGLYTLSDGSVYEGRFRNDKMEGNATFKIRKLMNIDLSFAGNADLWDKHKVEQFNRQQWVIPIHPFICMELKRVHGKAGFGCDGK